MTKEIQLTQGKAALVDDEDYEVVNNFKWHICAGYAQTSYRENGKVKNLYMHRFITNQNKSKLEVDHINGNRLDNRKSNLRVCSHSENLRNRGKPISNKSGYKGVDFHKRTGKWRASIGVMGRSFFLGFFKSAKEAADKYDEASEYYHGESGRKNTT